MAGLCLVHCLLPRPYGDQRPRVSLLQLLGNDCDSSTAATLSGGHVNSAFNTCQCVTFALLAGHYRLLRECTIGLCLRRRSGSDHLHKDDGLSACKQKALGHIGLLWSHARTQPSPPWALPAQALAVAELGVRGVWPEARNCYSKLVQTFHRLQEAQTNSSQNRLGYSCPCGGEGTRLIEGLC